MHGHAADLHAHVALAGARLVALARMRGQCAHADLADIDFLAVADAAIDDDAGPAIAFAPARPTGRPPARGAGCRRHRSPAHGPGPAFPGCYAPAHCPRTLARWWRAR